METNNEALRNEMQTLQEIVSNMASLCFRLTPDQSDVNAATIRSLYTQKDAITTEINNLSRLLDEYGN
jgi:hypothetical protein